MIKHLRSSSFANACRPAVALSLKTSGFASWLLCVGMVMWGGVAWGQANLTAAAPSATEAFTGYMGTSTLPTNWATSGTGTVGNSFQGTNQTTGTTGGWYGNNNMSYLGSANASNGNATWTLRNTTGATITAFTVTFDARLWRSQSGSPTVTVSYSNSVSSSVSNAGALPNALSSLTFSDATPNISTGTTLTQTVTGVSIANNDYIFLRFIHSGGSNSDNLGWDNVVVTASAAANHFRSKTTGNWGSASTWESSFDGTNWVNSSLSPDNNANSITVLNGHVVTVAASVSTDQTTIDAGGQVIVSSSQTLTIADGTGTDMTVNGTLATAGTVTNNGSLQVNGTFQINQGGFGGGANDFAYGASSTLVINYTQAGSYGPVDSGHRYFPTSSGPTNLTLQQTGAGAYQMGKTCSIAGTLTAQGTGTKSFDLQGFGFTAGALAVSGNLTMLGTSALTITGNASLNSGTFALSASSGGDFNLGGNWTRASGATFTPNGRAVNFNGSGTQTISVTGGGTETFAYLILNKSAGSLQLSSSPATNVTVNASIGDVLQLLNTGSLDLNGRIMTLSGTGGNISLNSGARNINSSISGGIFRITGGTNDIKTVTSGGSLTFASNVIVDLQSGLNFGSSLSTVNGTLQISSGGFVSTNPPTYGTGSLLKYNSGTNPYNRGAEWSTASSGPGYPNDVQVSSNTTLNYPNGSTAAHFMRRNLTIDAGSSFYMDYGSPGLTGALTVGGSVVRNGNLSLGDAAGGDIKVAGDWSEGTSNSFNANSRAVILNGASDQYIARTGGNTFAYLNFSKSGGTVNLLNNITVSNVLSFDAGNTANIDPGASTVIVSNSATGAVVRTGSGHVLGDLRRAIATGANTYSFPVGTLEGYTPVSVAFSSVGTGGNLTVNSNDANHPNFATYGLSATKYVSRHWNVTNSGVSSFNAAATFNYLAGDLQGGATDAEMKLGKYDASWSYPTSSTGSNAITGSGITSFSGFMAGACNTITVTATSNTPLCDGNNLILNASPSGGAGGYSYVWAGPNSFASGVQTPVITAMPAATGTYTVTVTDGAGCIGTATTAVVVSANATPTVSIAASPSGPICSGAPVTFTATAGNLGGGTVSNYDFKVNGGSVQSGGSNTYTTSGLANGDLVTVDITVAGGTCLTSSTASSNTITMTVNPNVTPTVSLAASPSGPVCSGTSVMFTAMAGNLGGGTVSNYDFKVNGNSVQSGGSDTYTTSSLGNGDQVTVDITVSGGVCLTSTTASSNTITMTISTPTFYQDIDGDGLGDPAVSVTGCTAPMGYVADNTDNCPLTVSSVSNSGNCGCQPGYFPVISIMDGQEVIVSCDPCPAGRFCPDGLTGPFLCPAGTYNDEMAQTQCQSCPNGTYNDMEGQTTCTSCPTLTFSATPTNTCTNGANGQIAITDEAGGTGPYQYSIDNGVNYGNFANITDLTAGSYLVRIKDVNGCESVALLVTVGSFPATVAGISGTPGFCIGGSTTLTASGGVDYEWDDPSFTTNATLVIGIPGTYGVTVTDANGCTDTESVTVVEQPYPDATLLPLNAMVCEGGEMELILTETAYPSGTMFTVNMDIADMNGFMPFSIQHVVSVASITLQEGILGDFTGDAGFYNIKVIAETVPNCQLTLPDNITVTLIPKPTAVITGDLTYCPLDGPTTLTASGGENYVWEDETIGDELEVSEAGTYMVTVTDANGCTDTESATVTEECADPGAALDFDGVNDYVEVPNINLAAQSFTVEFWAKRNGFANGDIVIGQGGQGANQGLTIGFRSTDEFTFGFYANDLDLSSSYSDNDWHHWACVYMAGTTGVDDQFIYRDGILVASRDADGDYVGSGPLYIGSTAWSADFFNGTIDELRIWNRALCQAEILARKDCEAGESSTGPDAAYSFNQGYAGIDNTGETTLEDNSGHGNLGTLYNFTLDGATSNWVAPGGVVSGTDCPDIPVATVTIEADPGNEICAGTQVTFTAFPGNGGANPTYQWYKNGNEVGNDTGLYVDNGLSDGDVISVMLIPDGNACPVLSAGLTMTVAEQPDVRFETFLSTICTGNDVELTFDALNYNNELFTVQYALNGGTPVIVNNVIDGQTFLLTEGSAFTGDLTVSDIVVTVEDGTACSVSLPDFMVDVQPQPTATLTPLFSTACEGGPLTLVFHESAYPSGTPFTVIFTTNNHPEGLEFNNLTDGDQFDLIEGVDFIGASNIQNILVVGEMEPFCVSDLDFIEVNVNHVTAGSIAGDQTICSGGNPAPFTEMSAATGDNTPTYRWESSTVDCINGFSPIGGATSATYDIPAGLTQTTYYRRVAISTLNGVACEAISNCVTVTVNSVTGGSIAADQTICSGGDPAAFTEASPASGTTLTYRWESSTMSCSTGFSPIGGATEATYDAPSGLTQTTYYRRVAISNVNGVLCEATSNCVTVTVNSTPSFTICPAAPVTANTGAGVCTAVATYTATATGTPTPTLTYAFTGATTGSGSGTGSGSTFATGSTNVVVTAMNTCGMTTCSFTVTVTDNQAPTAVCQNATVTLDGTGNVTLAASAVNNGSTDNCGTTNLSVSPSTFNCTNVSATPVASIWINEIHYDNSGTNDVNEFVELAGTAGINLANYAIIRYNGNTSSAAVIYTSPAQTTTLTGTIPNQSNGYGTFAVFFPQDGLQNGSNDGFALVNTSTNTVVQLLSYEGAFTVASGQGLASGMTSTNLPVSEDGTIAGGSIRLTGNGSQYSSFTWQSQVAPASPGAVNAGQTFPLSGNTVTLTVNDGNGNTNSCTATVTVQDATAPTLTCPSPVSIGTSSNGTGNCNGGYTIADPVSDNCSGATWTYGGTGATIIATSAGIADGTGSGVISFNKGVTTITLTAKDASNNAATTCTFTVTVTDDEAPILSCPTAQSLPAAGGCTATYTIADPLMDNCTPATWGYSATGATTIAAVTGIADGTGSGSLTFNAGVTTVVLTAVDAASLPATTCTFTVTVSDNQAPTALCQNVTVNLDGTGNATLAASAVNNGSSDNCGTPTLSLNPNTFNCSNITLGTPTDLIISEYVEGSGNNKYIEIYNPTSSAVNLANYELRLYANGSATATTTNTLSGTLASGTTIVYKNSAATVYTGTATSLSAVNWSGNDAIALFNTVTSQNVDIFGKIGNDPGSAWTLGGNTTADKTLRRKPAVYQGVTVNPSGTGPTAFTTLSTEWDQFNQDVVSGLGGHIGPGTVVTLTVTDGNNNSSTCSASVVVRDVNAPTLSCPSNPSVGTNSNGTGDCTGSYTIADPISDNCSATWGYSGTGVTTIPAVTGIADGSNSTSLTLQKGVTTITLTGVDASGNAATTCSFTVTVTDNEKPTLVSCPSNIALTTSSDGGVDCAVTLTYTPPTFSDNCDGAGAATYVSGPTSGSSVNVAGSPYSVVYTYTDVAGNAVLTNCTFTVTVADDTRPTLVDCPTNIALTTSSDGGADCAVLLTYTPPTYGDNCSGAGPAIYVSGPVSGSSVNVSGSPYTVVYTYMDPSGNAVLTNCTFTVTVTDDTRPTLVDCPTNIALTTSSDGGADCAVMLTYTPPTYSDNCSGTGPATYVSGPTSGSSVNVAGSPYTVVYTYTDGAGNAVLTNCTFTVTVTDDTKPTLVGCPSNIALTTSSDGGADCAVTLLYTAPTYSDNCSGTGPATYVSGPASGSSVNVAGSPYTVVYTYTDPSSNTVTTNCTFTVTVTDDTKPTLVGCPSNIALMTSSDGGADCAVTLTYTAPTYSDNCSGTGPATYVSGPTSGSSVNVAGSPYTVVYTYTDPSSNTVTTNCTFSVTVADDTKPTVTCPNNQVVTLNSSCQATLVDYTSAATVSDNCSAPANITVTQTPPPGTAINGTAPVTVVFTATDQANNTKTCSFTVTGLTPEINVTGNGQPIADGDVMPSLADHTDFGSTNIGVPITRTFTIQNTGTQPLVISSIVSTNNTDFTVGVLSPASPVPAGMSATVNVTFNAATTGTKTSTITIINNDCDESSYDFAIVANVDCTYPAFSACPGNQTATTTLNQCSAVVNYTATATGVPAPALSYTFTGATNSSGSGSGTGSMFNSGVTTVVLTATNACGSTSCSFTVTVNDGQNPMITCPANIVRNTDLNQCSAVVTYANPTFSDNCPGVSITRTGGLASGSAFPKGANMVNWKATDAAGNTAICGFTITVNDIQLPVIGCPASINKTTDANLCTAVVTYVTPAATDNCTPAPTVVLMSGQASGTAFAKGATLIVWKATDGAGLTKTCSFTINVTDGQAPAITCPGNQTKNTDPNLCSAIVTYTTPTATDNCAPAPSVAIQGGLASGMAFPKGQTTVIWRATDGAGVTGTCSFRVTVNDTQAPTITCPANQVTVTDPGLCTAVANYANATFTDNCPGGSVVKFSGLNSGLAFPKGVNNVTFKATDGSGNFSVCTMTITVNDAQLPSVVCPNNIVVTGTISSGVCSAQVVYTNPVGTDNCSGVTTYLLSGLASYSVFPEGVTTNVWRAVDGTNASSTCSFTITVSCGTGPESAKFDLASGERSSKWEQPLAVELGLKIAPNPAVSSVTVTMDGVGERGGTLLVYDAMGRLMLRQVVSAGQQTAELNVGGAEFATGIYQVNLRTETGAVTKPLVVSKL